MSKVYDCCMFFQETDMLELRFHILDDVVDHFVVCEAETTHSGQPKPLNFIENYERFRSWRNKVIYVNAGKLTTYSDNSWTREHYHRSKIADGLIGAQADDWIIVADCDEIPNPLVVRALNRPNNPWTWNKFELEMYYYDLNHKVDQGWAIGATRWGTEKDPNKIRTCSGASNMGIAMNGGWHFSWFNGPQAILDKQAAFMHAGDPVIRDMPRDPAWVAQRVSEGGDLFGRSDMRIEHVPLSDTLPRYVMDNIEHYRDIGWCD